jgi:hypothetical protein
MEIPIEPFPAEIENASQKELCIEPRIFNLMIFQTMRRPKEEFEDCHF